MVNLKNAGIVLLCVFVALDVLVRLRMRSIGYKWMFLRGATFDYGEYLKVRAKYRWSPWPVYLLWTALLFGLVLFLVGSARP